MTKTLGIAFGVGIAVIAVLVTGMLLMQRGARVGLTGQVLKVRTAPLDETSSAAVLDFRFANPAYVIFVVRSVKVVLEDPDGKQFEGSTISGMDAQRLFDGVPLLGQKFNEPLVTREKISAHTTADRMVAARFEAPLARIEARKRFLLRIEDLDGAVTELTEK